MLAVVLAMWAVLAQLCAPAAAATPEAPLLWRVEAGAIEARPGQVVTAAVTIVPAGADRALVESLRLPPGWVAATTPGRLQIAAGARRTRILAFQVGADAPAGKYTIRYAVADAQALSDRAEISLAVDVARVSAVSLALVGEPTTVFAGDETTLTFRATNLGNATERVRLVVSPEEALEIEADVASFDLAPLASRDVTLAVTTSRNEDRPTTRVLRVAANASGAQASAVAILPVAPRPGRMDAWRRFPVRASVVGTSDGARSVVQPTAEGRGALDGAGAYTAEFLLRPVDAEGTGAFGLRDELRLVVAGPWARAAIGDHVFGLSPLTDPGRYGRGAAAGVETRRFYARGYGAVERFRPDPRAELGATAGVRLGDEGRVGVQVLGRGLDRPETVVGSMLAIVPVGPHVTIEGEQALDLAETARPQAAGSLSVLARLPSGFSGTVREVVAAPDYDGQERDVHRTLADLSLPLVDRRLAVHGSFYRERRNLGLDGDRGSAPLDTRGEARVSWSPDPRWSFQGGAAAAVADDQLSTDGWWEAAGRLQVVRATPRLYASLAGAAGLHRDADTGAAGPGAQVGTFVAWSPTSTLALRGRAEWGTSDRARSTLFATETSVGLGARWQPARGLDTEVEARRRLDAGSADDQLDVRLQYGARDGAAVAARYRVARAEEADHSALLSVSVPFRVPVVRLAEFGSLAGRVVDADAPQRPGLAGVVLRVGDHVVRTRADGSFVFPRLPAGVARVEVEGASLGFGRVGVDTLPAPVVVPGQGRADLEIATTLAASLRGRVVLVGWSTTEGDEVVLRGDGDVREERPGAGLTVVIARGDERYTRTTDEAGGFSLEGLRPGTWTVTLPRSQVPRYFTAPEAGRSVVLGSGQTAEVVLRVEPMVRLIRMFEAPPLVVERPEPPAPARPTRPPPHAKAPVAEAASGADRTPARWARATLRGEANLTPDGTFLGGELVYELWDSDGTLACEARADWVDDGADLPVESCIDCAWEVGTATAQVWIGGPACAGLEPSDVDLPYGWAWSAREGERERVLLRWGGEAWVPVADGVDPLAPIFVTQAALPR